MKVDAEKGEGVDLAKQYNIRGYPTTVFVTDSGEEIDRIVGYHPEQEFLTEMERVVRGEDTYRTLKKTVAEDSSDVESLVKLAGKVEQIEGYSHTTVDLWQRIQSLTDTQEELHAESVYKVAAHQAMLREDPEPIQRYLEAHSGGMYTIEAYSNIVRIHREAGNPEQEAEAYQTMIEKAQETGNISANMLNSYAWRMTQIELNLHDALEKVEQAVAMVETSDKSARAQILDTKAEVLWKLGRTEEAVRIIETCIELQPDDEYYQKQKTKFLGDTA